MLELDKARFRVTEGEFSKEAELSINYKATARFIEPAELEFVKDGLEKYMHAEVYGAFFKPVYEFLRFTDQNLDISASNSEYQRLRSELLRLISIDACRTQKRQEQPKETA